MKKLFVIAAAITVGLTVAGIALASRSAGGTYTLPSSYNPVVSGQPITTTWANTTLTDVASELSDSLSRSGKGGMTAPLRTADGSAAAPAHSFTSETTSGLYRGGTSDVRLIAASGNFLQVKPYRAMISVGRLMLYGAGNALDFNLDYNGSSYVYGATGYGAALRFTGGSMIYGTAPSGSSGAAASLTDKIWWSTAGYIGIGATPTYPLDILPAAGGVMQRAKAGSNPEWSTFSVSSGSGAGFNAHYDGSNWKYDTSAYAAGEAFDSSLGNWAILTAPSGTAAATATMTTRLQVNTSGVYVGSGTSTPINGSYGGSITYDFAGVSAGDCEASTGQTLTGVAVGGVCSVSADGGFAQSYSLACAVTASNTVVIYFCNNHPSAALNPASQSYRVRVWQP